MGFQPIQLDRRAACAADASAGVTGIDRERLRSFLPAFESWGFDFGWTCRASSDPPKGSSEFPMVDRDPLPRWSHGRVTLPGDAAHPMLIRSDQNGVASSRVILDAQALARALEEQASPEEAFAAYETARLPLTAAIVRANRGNGPRAVHAACRGARASWLQPPRKTSSVRASWRRCRGRVSESSLA